MRRAASGAWRGAAVLLVAASLLAACGENFPEIVGKQHARVTSLVRGLGEGIAAGRVRNANMITQYARIVRGDRPEVAQLTDTLAKEGTTDGMAYASLVSRLSRVNRKPKSEREADASLDELLRIEAATDATVFNDSLIDVVNVLADMSNGKLARLHVPASAPKPAAGPGGHLVGNPRYGQWRNNSSGNSFWVFYGQYALMRSLFFRPGMYSYGSWYRGRGWSYYGDVGRHYYGGRTDSARWNRAARTYPSSRPRKSYGPLGSQRKLSTYGRASTRQPGSALRRATSGTARRGSSYSGSARSSRSRGFRGK